MPRQRQASATLDSMLNAVRREAAHATRLPRAALEAAIGQLLRAAAPHPAPADIGREAKQYRVDDLARAAGTTVRNVRAYQERGLLHAPHRVGRIAVFDDSHLARLKLITSMLDRGYTSANIAEMLTAWENGDDLADILGLQRLVRPWAADEPATMSLREVRELAGGEAALERLVADNLVDVRSNDAVVQRPRLLRALAEARGYGVPMDRMLSVHEQIAPMLEEIGGILVAAGARQVAAPLPAADEVTERNINDLVTMLLRFRALAMESVMATLEHAIDRRIETMLADYVAHLAGAPAANADAG
jgi:DNA-binding transcriptional MerR regulator